MDLDAELEDLKKNAHKVWYNFTTGTQGIVFIQLHEALKEHISIFKVIEHLIEKGEFNTRFTCRFIPILTMTKASGNLDEFRRLTEQSVKSYIDTNFANGSHFSWCLEYKCKNNQKIRRQEYLDILKEYIDAVKDQKNLSSNIDYNSADFDILFEVYRDMLMFGIVKNYKDRKKYNLQQLQINTLEKEKHEAEEQSAKKRGGYYSRSKGGPTEADTRQKDEVENVEVPAEQQEEADEDDDENEDDQGPQLI